MKSTETPEKPENRRAPALLLHGLSLFLCLAIVAYPDNANAQRKARGAAVAPAAEAAGAEPAKADPHAKVLEDDKYPSASKCKTCHEKIYDEWRSSNHAYAGISPMFHKFEQKINELAPTIGAFCVTCHMGVGTAQGEDRALPLWKRSQVSREGVTCISCHRVSEEYSKSNGERHIETGSIHAPVYGPFEGDGVDEAVKNPAKYRVATSDQGRGAKIHTKAIKF